MAKYKGITREMVCQVLDYNKETGLLIWKQRPVSMFGGDNRICNSWNAKYAGKEAGTIHGKGYIYIGILSPFKLRAFAHDLIWFIMTGEWPKAQIDHENKVKTDNRWDNLREATNAENHQNKSIYTNSPFGISGVGKRSDTGKFRARIMVNYKEISLGSYDTLEEAVAAREEGKRKYHSFHPEDEKVALMKVSDFCLRATEITIEDVF